MNITEVDVTDWTADERADVIKPFEVVASPYGETIREYYPTAREAQAGADYFATLTGTYNTSWGEQAVNTEVTILHYVDNTPEIDEPEAAPADAETEATEDVYVVTTTAGARLGYPAHAIRDTRADAIDVANKLHAHRVANGAEGTDSVRVERHGVIVWAIRDNGEIIH